MVMEDLVRDVHRDLSETLTQATTHKENPIIIRILKNLVRLTNIAEPEDKKSADFEQELQAAVSPVVSMPTPRPASIRALNFSQQMEQEAEQAGENPAQTIVPAQSPIKVPQNFSQQIEQWDESHPKL